MDEIERLKSAAANAQSVLGRVSGEGSILEQVSCGDTVGHLHPQRANDLSEVIDAMAEQVRQTRAIFGSTDEDPHDYVNDSMGQIVDALLPLNRKERFYTGTVLPMIVASDGFAHLHRLLRLCGLSVDPVEGRPPLSGLHEFEFFTEYSFFESCFTEQDRSRFLNAPTGADTPDIVLAGPDWLVAIEAKVFHNPLPDTLNHQMQRQRVLVDYWASSLHVDQDRVRHVLLLPEKLPSAGVTFPVITWENVLKEYRVVAPAYWTGVLSTALERYDALASSPTTFRTNMDSFVTGQQIVEGHAEGTLDFAYVGRQGGLRGAKFTEDVSSGNWRAQGYEVRYEAMPGNRNWFAVREFLQATAE